MEWKGEKSLLLSTHAGQKQKLWRDQIKENRSVLEAVGINNSNFKNEMLFVSFSHKRHYSIYIITTRNGWDGTNFYIGNRMVSSIKMSCNRLVNIIASYGNEGVQQLCLCQIDVGPFHWCKGYNIYYFFYILMLLTILFPISLVGEISGSQ